MCSSLVFLSVHFSHPTLVLSTPATLISALTVRTLFHTGPAIWNSPHELHLLFDSHFTKPSVFLILTLPMLFLLVFIFAVVLFNYKLLGIPVI